MRDGCTSTFPQWRGYPVDSDRLAADLLLRCVNFWSDRRDDRNAATIEGAELAYPINVAGEPASFTLDVSTA